MPGAARWLLAGAILAAACGNYDTGSGGSGEAKGGSGARDAVLEAWKKGGFTPSGLAPATVAFGKDCQSGAVDGVDVLICAYGSPADAKAAEAAAFDWVGSTTGTVMLSGAALIAVADRRKADASGRTINRLMKATPQASAGKAAADAK